MHLPVLLHEVIDGLNPQPGETWVDGTVGAGGHARALLDRLGPSGRLLGIDQDEQSLLQARSALSGAPVQVSLVLGNFRQLAEIAEAEGIVSANGVLLDLGFSSDQLTGHGLSFLSDEPLDMQLGTGAKFTALDIVNDWDESNLADVIYGYGGETAARAIARGIVAARPLGRIKTTRELVEIIRHALPAPLSKKRLHFATKTFQALRIAVNDELGALRDGLADAWKILSPGGRLGVISFHSLEARIVKEFFQTKIESATGEWKPKKAIQPARAEILNNPRARSAQLRIIKKIN